MSECRIRTRVWRNGTLDKEDCPFEQMSDYLAEPDPHAVEDAVPDHERPKATRYSTHLCVRS
jgi:magnesium transporter